MMVSHSIFWFESKGRQLRNHSRLRMTRVLLFFDPQNFVEICERFMSRVGTVNPKKAYRVFQRVYRNLSCCIRNVTQVGPSLSPRMTVLYTFASARGVAFGE